MYINALELHNKKNPNDTQVVMYWYMFKPFGEHGTTMIRLSAPVRNSTEETFAYMQGFVEQQLFSEMYEKGMKETKTVAEAWIAGYGVLGVFGIIVLFSIPVALIFSGKLQGMLKKRSS
jgi:hypothetical protein